MHLRHDYDPRRLRRSRVVRRRPGRLAPLGPQRCQNPCARIGEAHRVIGVDGLAPTDCGLQFFRADRERRGLAHDRHFGRRKTATQVVRQISAQVVIAPGIAASAINARQSFAVGHGRSCSRLAHGRRRAIGQHCTSVIGPVLDHDTARQNEKHDVYWSVGVHVRLSCRPA